MKRKLLIVVAVGLVLAVIAGGVFIFTRPHAIDVSALMTGVIIHSEEGDLYVHVFEPRGERPAQGWPVVLFLHGSGGRGAGHFSPEELNADFPVLQWLLSERNRANFPAFVMMPRCPVNYRWADGEHNIGNRLLDLLTRVQGVDSTRIYVIGFSMGGFGVVSMLAQHPDVFAAGVSIAGGWSRYDDHDLLPNLQHTPMWIFHGARDTAVDVEASRFLANELTRLGGDMRYTEYPRGRHAIENQVFSERELLPWLFAQRR